MLEYVYFSNTNLKSENILVQIACPLTKCILTLVSASHGTKALKNMGAYGRFWPIVFLNSYNEGEEFLMALVSLPDSLILLKQSMPSVRVPEAPAMTTHTHTLLLIQRIFMSQFCCWFCCPNWFWSLNGKTELHENLKCTPFSNISFYQIMLFIHSCFILSCFCLLDRAIFTLLLALVWSQPACVKNYWLLSC